MIDKTRFEPTTFSQSIFTDLSALKPSILDEERFEPTLFHYQYLPIRESSVGLSVPYYTSDGLLRTFTNEGKFRPEILQHPEVVIRQSFDFLSKGLKNTLNFGKARPFCKISKRF